MLAILASPPVTAINKLTAFFVIVRKKNNLYKFQELQNYKWKNDYLYFIYDINHHLNKSDLPRNHSANIWHVKYIQKTFLANI